MNNCFNLSTIKILSESKINDYSYDNMDIYICKVIGKYHGGKRYKRGYVMLTRSEIREIRLRDLLDITS